MVRKIAKRVVISALLDVIGKYVKKYGVRVFLEHFIKVVKLSKDEKMQKLAEDLQLALDNYVGN